MPRKTTTRKSAKRTSTRKRSSSIGRQLRKISKERKTDIIGVALLISGVIALLGFWGRSDGDITGWIVIVLSRIAGLGAIMFPFVLLLIGFWLIFRNEKRFPILSLERLLGIILLYFNILAWIHWFTGGGWNLAKSGGGGGYIGAVFEQLLVIALGDWGAFVVLLAWMLIALAFTFDVSIPDLFRNITQRTTKTGKFIKAQVDKVPKSNRRVPIKNSEQATTITENGEGPQGFMPIQKIKNRISRVKKPISESSMEGTGRVKPTLPDGVSIERIYHSAENSIKWTLPNPDKILNPASKSAVRDNLDQERARILEETLASFNAPGHVVEIHRGPTFTQFGIEPDFIETRKGKCECE